MGVPPSRWTPRAKAGRSAGASRLASLATLATLWAFAVASAAEGVGAPPRLDAAAVGTIRAPFARVRAVLLDLEAFDRWFPALGEWRVLSRSAAGARVYGRQSLPWPAQDRDYVVDYRWWDAPDGAFMLEARARNDGAPAPEGVVRLDILRSRWTIEPRGDETHARYDVELVPRGALPRWIEDAGWRRNGRLLIDALAREAAQRRVP